MRYQVPQFIEVEDKIFGPLTFKQAVYLVGGAALCYLLYILLKDLLPLFVIIVIAIPIIALGLALAFYKINNKPFINTMEAAFKYALGSKLYLWKKETRAPKASETQDSVSGLIVPRLSDSKLKDLAWNLDVSQSANIGINKNKDSNFKF